MSKENEGGKRQKFSRKAYERQLAKLEIELVKLQGWIVHEGLKVVVLFEGRDSAGKGGTIKRITYRMNLHIARVVALGTPTEKEKTQWYFQRYVKRHARLNVISHLLSLIPYQDLTPEPIELPQQQDIGDYTHPDISQFNLVPEVYP